MKRFSCFLFVLWGFVGLVAAEGGHEHHHHHVDYKAHEKDRELIRERLQQWQLAIEKKSLQDVVKFYAVDAVLMPAGHRAVMSGQIKAYWQDFFKQGKKVPKLSLNRIGMADDMSMAYAFGVLSKKGKSGSHSSGQFLIVWQKQNNQWLIVADSFAIAAVK